MNEETKVTEQEPEVAGEEFIHEEVKSNVEETEALIEGEAEKLAKEAEALRLLELALAEEKRRRTRAMFHQPTPAHNPSKGNGKTKVVARKAEKKAKTARKMSKASRKRNRS